MPVEVDRLRAEADGLQTEADRLRAEAERVRTIGDRMSLGLWTVAAMALIQARQAAVARALPRLQVTAHGDRGRAVADLAADWGVDPRTIHADVESLTRGARQ